MQSVQMENPKVFSSFLVIWITMANYLNFNIFMCPEYDYTERNGQLAKWSNDQLVNFSCLNSRLPSPFSLTLDLHLLNLATVDPTYYLKHT